MPDNPAAPNPEEDQKIPCVCGHHGIIEELRVYVYDKVPEIKTKVSAIWATISVITVCGGAIITILLSEVSSTRSEVKQEQVTHKSDTAAQLEKMESLVETIVVSTKNQELSALATEKSVAVFMERYSVMQELNRKEIEELNRRTKENHEAIQTLCRANEKFKKEER